MWLRKDSYRHHCASHAWAPVALRGVSWPLTVHRSAINAAGAGPAAYFFTIPKTQTSFLHACISSHCLLQCLPILLCKV